MFCPYCNGKTELVTGKVIYPNLHRLWSKNFYQCKPCDAHVGCRSNTRKPLGRLANPELRKAKVKAHFYFDQLWEQGWMTRSECYRWLSKVMGLPKEKTHIGMFDLDQCAKVVEVSKMYADMKRNK